MDCVFCAIAAGKIPANVAYEDENYLVFHDLHPKAPTHLLVIPKKHIASLASATEKDEKIISGIFLLAKEVATRFGLKGYQIQMNVGPEGGQEVMHIHLHILSQTSLFN